MKGWNNYRMVKVTNRFGSGTMWEEKDLRFTHVYFVSTACMSVTSDAVSFVERQITRDDECNFTVYAHDENMLRFGEKPIIVILGCQVTDLAILNDIRTAEKFHEKYPKAQIIMGGCLAYRFDIELPEWCARIGSLRSEYTPLSDRAFRCVKWQAPFWTDENGLDIYGRETSSLFKNYYPLKIGAGCHGKCKYCTIKDTRGEGYETDAYLQVSEFLDASNNPDYKGIVLTSDSPTVKQIKDWCHIVTRYEKPVSFRNVEPQIALACKEELLALASKGLLKIFHCPIQSNDKEVLKAMNRNVEMTFAYIDMAQELRSLGVYVATNIICDYVVDGSIVDNMPTEWLDEHFDYWVWNPYFDGNWDREKAEVRFKKYMPDKKI